MTTASTTLTWDALSYSPDVVGDSTGLLLDQFRNASVSTRVELLVSSFAVLLQQAEDALWDMLTLRGVDVATGDQLDQIGRIVGEDRLGASDDDYRARIRVRIRINRSNGAVLDVLDVAVLFEGITGTGGVEVRELFPMALVVELTNASTRGPYVTLGILNQARGAGVRLQLVYSTGTANTDFIGGDSAAWPEVTSTQGGGSTTDATLGGNGAGVAA